MHLVRDWLLASRPWSFTMTAISISVGGGLAALDGVFSWHLFLITLGATILLHGATNLINDYYDVKNGVDTKDVPTAQYRPHPLMEGRFTPSQIRNYAVLLYSMAFAGGVYLAVTRGWAIYILGFVGAVASIFYTAPPLKYKYSALGELSVFLMWGPLMVEGTYYVQRQQFSQEAFWISIPFGTLVALVLLGNNIRDIVHDQRNAITTLPMLLGKDNGIRLFAALIIMAYCAIVCMSLLGILHLWSLIVLASLPLAFRLLRQIEHKIPDDADARTAHLNTAFGVLLVLSLMLENMM
jgi:1,4-dihydroxy-2-naphthoate octaprenyltransferase